MTIIDTPDGQRRTDTPGSDQGGVGGTITQRWTFIRRCGYVGITLVVLGAAGLARGILVPLGGLVLVLGLLAWIIDLEPLPEVDDAPAPEREPHLERAPRVEPALDVEPEPMPAPPAPEPSGVVIAFQLPAEVGAQTVHLSGDFNDWSPTSDPLRLTGDRWQVDVRLEPGRSYRFRYLLDGHRWENDWHADEYTPNAFGTTDSVIHVPSSATPAAEI